MNEKGIFQNDDSGIFYDHPKTLPELVALSFLLVCQ